MAEPTGRARAYVVGLALLGATLSPLARPPAYDSFPFSSYPMFAHGRKDAVTAVDRAVAVAADGTRVELPPRIVATEEVLQAAATLRQAIRRGKQPTARLCRQIAARVAADPTYTDATRVEIVSERYDAVAYFAGDTEPIAKPRRRARCEVKR